MKKSALPLIGLGTWKLKGKECEQTVREALKIGYRHIDTADMYQNHQDIAKAIADFPRIELFITTKLWADALPSNKVEQAVTRFLEELKVDYLDLLLIHWPMPDVSLIDTLKAMLLLKEKGWARQIGVSNFVRFHLEEMDPYHFPILTNQIELHPYLQRRALVDACKKRDIHITAYRPLAKGAFENDPILQKIGKQYGKTPSQTALRWAIQKGISVIPKSSHDNRLKENFTIFDFTLTETEMKEIDQLDKGIRFCSPENLPVYED